MTQPILMRCPCSSTPVMAGIWTSAIKQPVSTRRGEARKTAADAKTSAAKANDLMSLRIDSRKNRSSSTIETNAFGIRSAAVRSYPRYGRLHNAVAPCSVPCAKECRYGNASECKHWLRLGCDSRKLHIENAVIEHN